MIRYLSSILLFSTFANRVLSLSAIAGSPCYDLCNGDQATSSADIVCVDDDFTNTTKGETLTQCLTCLQTSSYGSGFMTDPILFLYYLSSVQQTCLSGKPAEPISNCANSCTNISSAFSTVGGRSFFQSPYSYCTEDDNAYEDGAADCATCLQDQEGTVILGNFVYVGKIGCDTQPDVASGALVFTSDDLFNTETLGSGDGNSTSSTTPTSTSTSTNSSETASSTTAGASATSASPSASASTSAAVTHSAAAASSSADSNSDSNKDEDGGSGGLSRGAAAGIGIVIGILGVAAIVFLALFARRRVAQKQAGGGAFNRMQDSPQMQQVQDWHRSATPPAAGVFVPPNSVPAAAGTTPAIPPIPAAAAVAVPKKSKSFKSIASKSMKSLRMTPRTSEWYYAANPKASEDLSALPQKGWD